MPRGDGTGPAGLGPMTGRALGYCAGYSTPGYTKGPGMGLGFGFGRGRGRGRWFGYGRGLGWGMGWGRGYLGYGRGYLGYGPTVVPPVTVPPTAYTPISTPEAQLEMLKQERQYLEAEMEAFKKAIEDISKRIGELEKQE